MNCPDCGHHINEHGRLLGVCMGGADMLCHCKRTPGWIAEVREKQANLAGYADGLMVRKDEALALRIGRLVLAGGYVRPSKINHGHWCAYDAVSGIDTCEATVADAVRVLDECIADGEGTTRAC